MAQSISTWSRKAKSECKNMSIEELSSNYFFRDPIRPIKNNSELIYAPADGIILDCKEISSIHDSILTKYNQVTLDNLSHSQIDEGAYWIVTIFLTFYDPHIIRIPTNGFISRLDLPPYYTEDRPMLEIENNILNNEVANIKQELLASISFNQRVLLSIKPSFKNENYHTILTADYDVDTVISFFAKPSFIKQSTRIASVRYGSMVTCIIPKKWNINPLQKINTHIEAGVDPIFEFL